MKKLYYIPIVHSQIDLGSTGSILSSEGEKKFGQDLWKQHLENTNKMWETLRIKINEISDVEHIKIYQDGLPTDGETGLKIVKDVALSGSVNYSIIIDLINKGGELILSENIKLLMKEYDCITKITESKTDEELMEDTTEYKKISVDLLNDRDQFVSNQINSTLNDGDTGFAFFGASHSIIDKLNKDIDVEIIEMFTDDITLKLNKK